MSSLPDGCTLRMFEDAMAVRPMSERNLETIEFFTAWMDRNKVTDEDIDWRAVIRCISEVPSKIEYRARRVYEVFADNSFLMDEYLKFLNTGDLQDLDEALEYFARMVRNRVGKHTNPEDYF